MQQLLQTIFSVKNSLDKKHKVITICGFRIKLKNKFQQLSYRINDLENKNDVLSKELENINNGLNQIKSELNQKTQDNELLKNDLWSDR